MTVCIDFRGDEYAIQAIFDKVDLYNSPCASSDETNADSTKARDTAPSVIILEDLDRSDIYSDVQSTSG